MASLSLFLSKFEDAPEREWLIAAFRRSHHGIGKILPRDGTRPLSAAGREALGIWDFLDREDKEELLESWEVGNGSGSWLSSPALKVIDSVLAAVLELEIKGDDSIRVEMVTDLLAASGRSVRNTSSFIRHLVEKGKLEPVSEGGARGTASFKLTSSGRSDARVLKRQLGG